MADAWGNVLDPPGYKTIAEVKPADILAAMGHGIVKKGVTIAKLGAGGLIPAGTILGVVTSTKKYVAYSNAETNGAGSGVAKGILAEAVDTTGGDKLANIFEGGTFKLSKLTGLDGNAVTDLNGRSDTTRDYFHF
jgi:head decoration protein D